MGFCGAEKLGEDAGGKETIGEDAAVRAFLGNEGLDARIDGDFAETYRMVRPWIGIQT